MKHDLTGVWKGQFGWDPPRPAEAGDYEPRTPFDNVPEPIEFEMTIRRSWPPLIRGSITDPWPQDSMGTCSVNGMRLGRRVWFTKAYAEPSIVALEGEDAQFMRYVRNHRGDSAAEGFPFFNIRMHYAGTFDFERESLSGTWRVRDRRFRMPDMPGLSLQVQGFSGTWWARRPG